MKPNNLNMFSHSLFAYHRTIKHNIEKEHLPNKKRTDFDFILLWSKKKHEEHLSVTGNVRL